MAKGDDYTQPKPAEKKPGDADVWSAGTFDNDATTWEMRFLALTAAPRPSRRTRRFTARRFCAACATFRLAVSEWRAPADLPARRRLPRRHHLQRTDAMTQALEVMRDVADGRPEFAFVPAALRAECGRASRAALRASSPRNSRTPPAASPCGASSTTRSR